MNAVEPYEALARLAERELELVAGDELPTDEQLDELAALQLGREALVAELPPNAPAAAAPALARAAALQERVTTELTARTAQARRALADVERGRRTAHGYGGRTPVRGTLDLAG